MDNARVLVRYLTTAGRYKDKVCQIEADWPLFARNFKSKPPQSHYLGQRPIFQRSRLFNFNSWQEFMAAPEPPPQRYSSSVGRPKMIVCFEGQFTPLGLDHDPLDEERIRLATTQMSEQKVLAEEGERIFNESAQGFFMFAISAVIVIMTILAAMIIVPNIV